MRARTVCVVVASLAALVVSDVLAQPGGGRRGGGRFGRGGGVDRMELLESEKVQQALKVTPQQLQQITDAEEAMREDRRGGRDFGDFQDMTQEERREAFARMRTERVNQELAKLGEVLDESQMQRLNEIYVQVQGAQALMDPKVSEKLNISAAQAEELQTVQRDSFRSMMEEIQDLGEDASRDERRAKMEEVRNQTNEQLLAVLSDSQKDAFAQMKGEQLELTEEELSDLRGGGRRGGGFRGGRGNRGGDDE